MRLAVLADIHGNLPALEAVLDDLQQHDTDGIIVAGDLVDRFPHPVETIRLLRSLDSWMIRGNSDNGQLRLYAGDIPDAWRVNRQFASARWTYRNLDRETLDFIASLPEQRVISLPDTEAIRVVHGSPSHITEGIKPDLDPGTLERAFACINERILVCSHTHVPWWREQGGRLALNPGAVANPLDGKGGGRAQYALLTWKEDCWQVQHREALYDLERLRAAFRDSGLLQEGGAFTRALLLSVETGHDVVTIFLSYANGVAAEAGIEDRNIIPDEVWEEAEATFRWDQVV